MCVINTTFTNVCFTFNPCCCVFNLNVLYSHYDQHDYLTSSPAIRPNHL